MDNKIGKKAKDKITGFTGIIIGKAEYLYGCTQYAISPQTDKEGKLKETHWFDEGRIEIIGNGVLPKSVQVEKKGGPNSDAPTGRY